MRDAQMYAARHGSGRPIFVLHGAGVDHREAEACFEPALAGAEHLQRIYPDLPGMGKTRAPEWVRSADDVVDVLLDFAAEIAGDEPYLLIGHSAGAYFAHGMAMRRPESVSGLALVCPLLSGIRDVPEHRVVAGSDAVGDDEFRGYFVEHTHEMLRRYERFVRPGAALVDLAAQERIGADWELTPTGNPPYPGPALIVAGRWDSTVGWAAAADLAAALPSATFAVIDRAGHALPHEQPDLLRALIAEWLGRADQAASG